MSVYGQGDHLVRADWGPTGARACGADVSIVVDVLSFSTSVTIAVGRGTQVFPCPWRDPRAEEFARTHDAVLAVGRLEANMALGSSVPSLSPAGLLGTPPVPRLVLPSPNGSAIASQLRGQGSTVAIGCLRNAGAAASFASRHVEAGRSVAIIAAGERWASDDSLRPALEDHLGVGAIARGVRLLGHGRALSPEASAAAALFDSTRPTLADMLATCVGGRELAARGFAADVAAASALNASTVVPVLHEGGFFAS